MISYASPARFDPKRANVNDMWFDLSHGIKSGVYRSDGKTPKNVKKGEPVPEAQLIAILKPEYRLDEYYVDVVWHLLYKGSVGTELGGGNPSMHVHEKEDVPATEEDANTYAVVWIAGRDALGEWKCAVAVNKSNGEIRYWRYEKGAHKRRQGGCIVL